MDKKEKMDEKENGWVDGRSIHSFEYSMKHERMDVNDSLFHAI